MTLSHPRCFFSRTLTMTAVALATPLMLVCSAVAAPQASAATITPATQPVQTDPSDPTAGQVQTPGSLFHWSASTGLAWQSRSHINGGGDVSITRSALSGQGQFQLTDQLHLNVGLGFERDEYRFSSVTRMGNDPWENVNFMTVQALAGWHFDKHWTLLGGPIISFAAEDAARWSRAATFGGVAIAAYRFSDQLSIAGGLGVMSRLEDSTLVFPVIRVDWQINDQFSLHTGTFDLGAQGGAGVEANWQLCPELGLGLGVQYQNRRFRLDRRDIAPDGVGQQSGLPVYLKATWTPCSYMTLSGFAGVQFAGRVRLEDQDGNRISSQHYDPAAILGARLSIQF